MEKRSKSRVLPPDVKILPNAAGLSCLRIEVLNLGLTTGVIPMNQARLRFIVLSLVLAFFGILPSGPPEARAQYPTHRLESVFPAGGLRGGSVKVELSGGDLNLVEGLWFNHPGLNASKVEGDAKPPRFLISIAPDTPIGLHDVRAVGPYGVSNPRSFKVGWQPEAFETEPNNQPEDAKSIEIGEVINGRINGNTDLDWFAFEGSADRRVLIRLEADRIDSRLDAELRLYDPEGRELAYSHDDDDLDPFIDTTLPIAGTYRIEVRDVVYSGSPQHCYRLVIDEGPQIDAIQPMAAVPGTREQFKILGRNLGKKAIATNTRLSVGHPLEVLDITIEIPEDLSTWIASESTSRTTSPAAGVDGYQYRLETEDGFGPPILIARALGPVTVGTEATDTEIESISIPADISADFREVDDVDIYQFDAKKGDVWWIEVFGERMGSPVDAAILVQQVREDGSLRDLANADDQGDPGTRTRFSTGTVDPALRWQVPEDGSYQVVVSDLYNPRYVAPRTVYRLVIRSEEPDFRLFLAPEQAARPEGLTLRSGGRGVAYVLADRSHGFNAPNRVTAEGLPDGVSAEPVIIGGNEVQVPIVFDVAPDAPSSLGEVRLVGRGLSGDRKEMVAMARDDSSIQDEIIRWAVPGSITQPPPQNNQAAIARVTRGFIVAVRPEAPFRVKAEPAEVLVTQGESFELKAILERPEDSEIEVQINATDLPNRVGGANVKIEKDKKEGTLKLNVPNNVEPGIYTILLRGTGSVTIPDPNDDSKTKKINVVQPSNPITLTVRKK